MPFPKKVWLLLFFSPNSDFCWGILLRVPVGQVTDALIGAGAAIKNILVFSRVNQRVHISDRKGQVFQIYEAASAVKRGRLKPGPKWTRPTWLSPEEWMEVLETSWSNHVVGCPTHQRLMNHFEVTFLDCTQLDVQKEWDLYMECLRSCFLHAYQFLLQRGVSDEQQMELVRILKTPGVRTRGAMAQFQWVNGHNPVKGDPYPGEPLRRVRRQLARSFEILRLCRQGKVPNRSLLQKVWPRGPFPNQFQDIRSAAQTQIHQLQRQQSSIEEQQKRTRIQAWKFKINDPSLKGISRWIKSREQQNAQAEVVFGDTKGSLPHEITSIIHQYWNQEFSSSNFDVPAAIDRIVPYWSPTGLSDLWKAIRDAHGTHGPDNWNSDEIKYVPVPAIQCFHQCTLRWHHTGWVPKQLFQSRHINLFKNHKIRNDQIQAGDLRPISIMSVWWRVFSSAWTKSPQVREWTTRFLNKQVSYGKDAVGTESLMDVIQDKFASHPNGCVTSLDWTHAFDTMRPVVTTEVMKRFNLAPQLANVLQAVWMNQTRFLQFENHAHNEVLPASQAMPQGDPISPLRLSIWVSAGLNAISKPGILPLRRIPWRYVTWMTGPSGLIPCNALWFRSMLGQPGLRMLDSKKALTRLKLS